VLAIPGWLLCQAFVRQRSIWGRAILILLALAVAYFGYTQVLEFPFVSDFVGGRASFQNRLLAALIGLLVLAFPGLLVIWLIRRRWRKAAVLTGLALILSLGMFAINLVIDLRDLDPDVRIAWRDCWFYLAPGSMAAGALAVIEIAFAWIAQRIMAWRLRSSPQARVSQAT